MKLRRLGLRQMPQSERHVFKENGRLLLVFSHSSAVF